MVHVLVRSHWNWNIWEPDAIRQLDDVSGVNTRCKRDRSDRRYEHQVGEQARYDKIVLKRWIEACRQKPTLGHKLLIN